jgi:TetR/AcrR family transcriptional regulator
MPKATFFNLPADKREHIIRVAVEEFAGNDYGDVSISRIVARAGIAKGSFYQYFADKEDLYTYLLDLAVHKKWEIFSLDQPDPYHIGVFRYLRWMAQSAVQFEWTYPELTRMGYRALRHEAMPRALFERYRQEALTFYRRLVATGKAQGDIDPAIDDDLAAFMLEGVFTNLGEYLVRRVAAQNGTWQGQQAFFELPEVARLFDQAINILEHGLGGAQAVGEQDRKQGQPVQVNMKLPEERG